MASGNLAEHPFFIYDHDALAGQEDDIKDAIIYYFPPMTSINDRCALCGQLMGIIRLFVTIAGAAPSVYRLQRSKFAVRHLGRFTFALGGDGQLPDRILHRQLDFAYDLFRLYHRNMDDIAKLCKKQGRDFVEYIGIIWDTYIPFTRYYGDNFFSAMRSVPILQLTKGQALLFLRANHLLESCQRAQGALAGCLLVRNRVLCTQLSPAFTSRLLLLRPHQSHLPCRAINTDYTLPHGVRLLEVYITKEEEQQLYPSWFIRNPPQSDMDSQSATRDSTQSDVNQHLKLDPEEQMKERTDSFVSSGSFVPVIARTTLRNKSSSSLPNLAVSTITEDGDVNEKHGSEEHLKTEGEIVGRKTPTDSPEGCSLPDESCSERKEIKRVSCTEGEGNTTSNDTHNDIINKYAVEIAESVLTYALSVLPQISKGISVNGNNHDNPTHISSTLASGDTCSNNNPGSTTSLPVENGISTSRSGVLESFCEEIASSIIDSVINGKAELVEPCKVSVDVKLSSSPILKGETDLRMCSSVEVVSDELAQSIIKSVKDAIVGGNLMYPRSENHIESEQNVCCENTNLGNGFADEKHPSSFTTDQKDVNISRILQHNKACNMREIPEENTNDTTLKSNGVKHTTQTLQTSTKPSIPLMSVHSATKTELFRAVKQASKIAVQNYESMSSEDSPSEHSISRTASYSGSGTSVQGFVSSPADASSNRSNEKQIKQHENALQVQAHNKNASQGASYGWQKPEVATSSPSKISDTSKASIQQPSRSKRNMTSNNLRGPKRACHSEDGLREIDLFIQGNADMLLLMVMEGGASQNKETVSKLWQWALPQLGEMDLYIKQRQIKGHRMSKQKDLEYNYLLYNSSQQTLSGNMTQPVSVNDHTFCDTAIQLHDEFCSSETLTDIMLRSHNSYVYAHNGASQETYFQLNGAARNIPGFPNEKQTTMAADAVAFQKMLSEEQTLII